ncbi:PepSY domain-containing protein [Actinomadura alba]|uniref:PepSY domain-containing protein n=1 Tax=Actinomadura alba TaxID=406431 RepID=A0ABR7LH94_9ACTN|nr:PepSY domain-containing protein [Actinomadura alba]MBC6464141.1 PepSY domain-containing protein [Actinomadura alba]
MRRTTVIAGVTGAAIVLGGGIALAFDGGGASPGSAGRTAVTSPASPEVESGAPTDDSFPTASPSTTPSPSSPSAPESPSASPMPSAPTAIDRAEAVRIALRTVPGGRIESVERETEHGRAVWDIDVIAGAAEHDLDIDARTGEVLRHRKDDDKGDDDRGHDDSGHDDQGHDDRGHDD